MTVSIDLGEALENLRRAIQREVVAEQAFVVLMPGRLSGKATIGHRRISTVQVADMYWELGFDELERGYDLTPGEVTTAVWYEARYGSRSHRQRWAEWLKANEAKLWSPSFYGRPDAPPTQTPEEDE